MFYFEKGNTEINWKFCRDWHCETYTSARLSWSRPEVPVHLGEELARLVRPVATQVAPFKFRESTRAGAKGAPRSSAIVHIRPCTKQAAPQLKRRCLPANHPCANHAMRVACVSYGAYFIAAHHHPSISPPVNVNLLSHVPPSRRPVHLFSRLHCRCFTLHDR